MCVCVFSSSFSPVLYIYCLCLVFCFILFCFSSLFVVSFVFYIFFSLSLVSIPCLLSDFFSPLLPLPPLPHSYLSFLSFSYFLLPFLYFYSHSSFTIHLHFSSSSCLPLTPLLSLLLRFPPLLTPLTPFLQFIYTPHR